MGKFSLFTLLSLATSAIAWDVVYYDDIACRSAQTGYGSYTKVTPDGLCIIVDAVNTVSATVSNKLSGQNVIIFLTGSNCDGQILGSAAGDKCVEFYDNGFGSVLVK